MDQEVVNVDIVKKFMKEDEKQQRILQNFFKEETTWCPEHIGWTIVAVIFLGVYLITSFFPYQVTFEEEDQWFPVFLIYYMGLMGYSFYIKKFFSYMEDGKDKKLSEILRFLPVSGWQLAVFRLKKLIRLCSCFCLLSMASQIFFAAVVMRQFTVYNLLHPMLCHLLLPLVIPGIGILLEASK